MLLCQQEEYSRLLLEELQHPLLELHPRRRITFDRVINCSEFVRAESWPPLRGSEIIIQRIRTCRSTTLPCDSWKKTPDCKTSRMHSHLPCRGQMFFWSTSSSSKVMTFTRML